MFSDHGSFRIRGTVRDLKNVAKLDPLKEFMGDKWNSVELA